jgi:hypothetical protein
MDIVLKILIAVTGPPFIAVALYATLKLLAEVGRTNGTNDTMMDIVGSTDPRLLTIGLVPVFAYCILYIVFLVQHTTRAVPAAGPGGSSVKWQRDRESAYRSNIWTVVYVANIIIHALAIAAICMYGHASNVVRSILAGSFFWPVLEACMVAVYHCRFRLDNVFVVASVLPISLSGWYLTYVWSMCYNIVRYSDFTWGTRTRSHEDESEEAKLSERIGKRASYALLAANLVCFGFLMACIHSQVDIFSLGGSESDPKILVVGVTSAFAAFPDFGVGRALQYLFIVWCVAIVGEVTDIPGKSGKSKKTSFSVGGRLLGFLAGGKFEIMLGKHRIKFD